MLASHLILKRASTSRSSGEWSEDDYDVLCEGAAVGRIMKAIAAPVGTPWLWTLAYGHHEDRTPIYGYEATREAAIAAFAKSWRRVEKLMEAARKHGRYGHSHHDPAGLPPRASSFRALRSAMAPGRDQHRPAARPQEQKGHAVRA